MSHGRQKNYGGPSQFKETPRIKQVSKCFDIKPSSFCIDRTIFIKADYDNLMKFMNLKVATNYLKTNKHAFDFAFSPPINNTTHIWMT